MTTQPHMLEGLQLRCPRCGEAEVIGHESLGKQGRCRRCGTLFSDSAAGVRWCCTGPAPHAAAGGPSYTLVIVAVALVTAILVLGGIFAFERIQESQHEKVWTEDVASEPYKSEAKEPAEIQERTPRDLDVEARRVEPPAPEPAPTEAPANKP